MKMWLVGLTVLLSGLSASANLLIDTDMTSLSDVGNMTLDQLSSGWQQNGGGWVTTNAAGNNAFVSSTKANRGLWQVKGVGAGLSGTKIEISITYQSVSNFNMGAFGWLGSTNGIAGTTQLYVRNKIRYVPKPAGTPKISSADLTGLGTAGLQGIDLSSGNLKSGATDLNIANLTSFQASAVWTTAVYTIDLGTVANISDVSDLAVFGLTVGLNSTSAMPGDLLIDKLSATVIPEPATLGLIAAMGTGILFIRRRFMM